MTPFEYLFNLGTRSGMPKYMALLGLLQVAILFVPESVWFALGVNGVGWSLRAPPFVRHYVAMADFKNAMFLFWAASPFTFLITFLLSLVHINLTGYQAYLERRAARLQKIGKRLDFSLVAALLATIAVYVWATVINMNEVGLLGNLNPTRSRFGMLIIHGAAIGLFIPVGLTLVVTEIRASISTLIISWR
jgi:hypothetical protein